MSNYTMLFNRIAEKLIFLSLKQHIINKIQFPSNHIFLQAPYDQYINTRTEAMNKLEQDRYPAISIYTLAEEEDKAFQSWHSEQIAINADEVRVYESDMMINATVEICLETTTIKDYMEYKNKLLSFFSDSRNGLQILNDVLPTFAGFSILYNGGTKDFYDNDIRSSVFTVKLQYRIYKEYIAYIFKTYDLILNLDIGVETLDNSVETVWSNNLQLFVDLNADPPNLQNRRTILKCINPLPANTPVNVMSSGIYFDLTDLTPDLRTMQSVFNGDVNIQIESNGMPLDKGLEVMWYSSSQIQFDRIVNIGETITIYS